MFGSIESVDHLAQLMIYVGYRCQIGTHGVSPLSILNYSLVGAAGESIATESLG